MNDRPTTPTSSKHRNSPRATGRGGGPARIPDGGFKLDEATAAELTKFNVYLEAQQQIEARERAVKKAEQARDQASARVRELDADPKAPKSDRDAAEAAYKEAVANVQAAKEGRAPADVDEPAPSGVDSEVEVGEVEVGEVEVGGVEVGGVEVGGVEVGGVEVGGVEVGGAEASVAPAETQPGEQQGPYEDSTLSEDDPAGVGD